jgi:hypothetical protein
VGHSVVASYRHIVSSCRGAFVSLPQLNAGLERRRLEKVAKKLKPNEKPQAVSLTTACGATALSAVV